MVLDKVESNKTVAFDCFRKVHSQRVTSSAGISGTSICISPLVLDTHSSFFRMK